MSRLKVTEIFVSLQGEPTRGLALGVRAPDGLPAALRVLRHAYAFHGGQWLTLGEILEDRAGYGVRHVCVTGGEPLAQPACHDLLAALCDAGYQVSLETSGALDIAAVDRRVSRVLDLKTPASGEAARNLENLDI